jgi:flagellar basal-body rod protein FlgB
VDPSAKAAMAMTAGDMPLFERMKARLGWLDRRQAVLADTIANADTPGFRPRDLAPFRFADVLAGPPLAVTDARHLVGGPRGRAAGAGPSRTTYEVAPAGNAVILEEQMMKVNETTIAHNLTTQLYRKYLGLMRTATAAKG